MHAMSDQDTVSPGIGRVIAYIAAHGAEKLPLSTLAALCGLSLHRFVTVFRAQIGIPPHQYVCRQRVIRAQALLAQGVPLAEVALDVGFCDQSHLSRQFKRHCGTTPGHARKAGAPPLDPAKGRRPWNHDSPGASRTYP